MNEAAHRPVQVLVVDDEALVAFDIADQCEAAGYEVIGPALTLNQGLELVAQHTPSLALLDINIRNELVWPLARVLRERSVPTVFISANCRHAEIDNEFTAAACLDKPINWDQVMQTVAPLLGLPYAAD
ncbi:response regulator [Croceicoccus mobilis]|uniref:Response regulatory domain-containing protein n=1 Tax=Croceicoccus mobilis TaxID=1703339 RepID=A0A917DV95_9SPHN|nr:response regulator [Croceicoccus mobilis]GGD70062.1 hypothetical protein GCM10010990_19490 [Croceicoccus mobilis]